MTAMIVLMGTKYACNDDHNGDFTSYNLDNEEEQI